MKIKIKKLSDKAVTPSYAKPGDAGLDLTATSKTLNGTSMVTYGTDLAIEIPSGYVGLIFPRSSISKTPLSLANSVGVIDSGYRGEIMLKFRYIGDNGAYEIGDKIGQLVIIPYPQIELEEVKELSTTARGTGGFGSTDKVQLPVNPLVFSFTDIINKRTDNKAKIRRIHLSKLQHEDEVAISVAFDFEYEDQDFIHNLHTTAELEEWLTKVL